MKAQTREYGPNYWANQVLTTRQYGQTYVHSGARQGMAWNACTTTHEGREIRFSWCGWGRSLQSGGHKYKVHAAWTDTGTPVPSKVLSGL